MPGKVVRTVKFNSSITGMTLMKDNSSILCFGTSFNGTRVTLYSFDVSGKVRNISKFLL
jgi:hypothetical protein